jgi:hypothetical protein
MSYFHKHNDGDVVEFGGKKYQWVRTPDETPCEASCVFYRMGNGCLGVRAIFGNCMASSDTHSVHGTKDWGGYYRLYKGRRSTFL